MEACAKEIREQCRIERTFDYTGLLGWQEIIEILKRHAPAVQAGMVMVPVEPTEAMVDAACAINCPSRWDGLIKEVTDRYKAMIAAAPKGCK